MSLDACAALVAKGDPDRWAALMAMPVAARARLIPLYAFNLELARAPWVTQEPAIAEMRLQWWREVVEGAVAGAPPRAHEVAGPLHALIREAGLPGEALDRLAAARRRDVWGEPFADEAALWVYLEDTGGGLMWLSVRALGGGPEAAARDLGAAAGLASWLMALPELQARGRPTLPEGAEVPALAREGLARLQRARGHRRALGPAGIAGWLAGPVLGRAAAGRPLHLSEAARRARLAWVGLTGRW